MFCCDIFFRLPPRFARVCYSASLTSIQMTLPFFSFFLLVTVCQDRFIWASLGKSWLFKTSKHVHTFSVCSYFSPAEWGAWTFWVTHQLIFWSVCVLRLWALNERWHLSPQREPEMDGSSNLWRCKITTCYASQKIAAGTVTLKLQFPSLSAARELPLMKFRSLNWFWVFTLMNFNFIIFFNKR